MTKKQMMDSPLYQLFEELKNSPSSIAPLYGRPVSVAVFLRSSTGNPNSIWTRAQERVAKYSPGFECAGYYTRRKYEQNRNVHCLGSRMDLFPHAQEGKFDLLITSKLSDFDANLETCTDTIWELLLARPPVGIYIESLNFYSLMPNALRYMKYLQKMLLQNEESKRCGGVLWEL